LDIDNKKLLVLLVVLTVATAFLELKKIIEKYKTGYPIKDNFQNTVYLVGSRPLL
jgi:hypothetical protein